MTKKNYVLYRTDMWHSKNSRVPLVIADNLSRCYSVAKEDGATEEQILDLIGRYHQSRCYNTDEEYEIVEYTINESLIS